MSDLKQMRKDIKKELEAGFGKGNVSVKASTGTASHWTHILIKNNGLYTYDEIMDKAHEVESKYDFPTYLQDDGYNDSYSSCVLIQVEEV